MLNLISDRVFYYFNEISKIPHGSGNCKAISEYCIAFAKNHSLEYYTDELYNVVIKKPSYGSKSEKPVILQGHLDMVCEKEEGVTFNFEKDALVLKTEDDWLTASGTTLGADNGIAVAMVLAILEDNTLTHPPIEAVFTTDEETGMYGAIGLNTSLLNGKSLINIDSENEGVITVSCAGGVRADVSIPLITSPDQNKFYEITLSGLLGGHSGVEIHKARENANILMGRLLNEIKNCRIKEISGGDKDNVITPNSVAVISSDDDLSAAVNRFLSNGFKETPEILVKEIKAEESFDLTSSQKIIGFLNETPNGVIAFSKDIEGLVETSLNLGRLKTENKTLIATFALRSSVTAEKKKLLERLTAVAESFGGSVVSHSDYPAWEYRKNSPLREALEKTYFKMYNKKPVIEAIHAGLECGLFAEKIKDIDAVSVGPNMCDIHSPKERLSVSSAKRTFEFIKECLKCLAKE